MHFVGRVLWFIESHFRREIDLDGIARACGVSRFHMCRGFTSATGYSVMDYVRGRRLTEAARQLAAGAPSILDVALTAGYNSHEAFTRAFRDRFGTTPEAARDGTAVDQTLLVEPIRMDRAAEMAFHIAAPRREKGEAMTVVGLSRRYKYNDVGAIPSQWTEFQAFGGTLGERPGIWFGLCDEFEEAEGTFRYTCGVRVDDPRDVPEALTVTSLPAQNYLAFPHKEHVSRLRETMNAIWGQYLPDSGFEPVGDRPMFELYDQKFDPLTGLGGLEVWIPVKTS